MAHTLASSNADNSWGPNDHSRAANYYKKNTRRYVFLGNIFLLYLLLCITACRDTTSISVKPAPITQTTGIFKEYPLPQAQSGLMRPAVDQQGRIWFGEMGKNYLASFDPQNKTFAQITPPHGQYDIMGVTVAPDNTIWFAEQLANYIGRYDPKSKHFTTYALPQVTMPDPANKQHRLNLPSAPNELIADRQGNIWFTEMNADAIGKLQIKTGIITQYPLTSPPTVQKLSPYSITADAQGNIWFTSSGESKIGRITPHDGAIQFYTIPKAVQDSGISLMEIVNDPTGMLWITTFNTSSILCFDPSQATFTTYQLSSTGQGINGVYGIIAASGNYLWITVAASNAIVRFDITTKRFTNYTIPTARCTPLGIVMAPDHTLWFTESATSQLGMFKP